MICECLIRDDCSHGRNLIQSFGFIDPLLFSMYIILKKKKNFIPEIPWLPASWFISRIWNFRYMHQLLQCALQVCHNGKFSSHLFVAKLKWNWFRIISAQKSLTLCVTEYWFVFVTWPFSDLIVVGTIYGISLELNLTQINAFHSSTFEPIDNSSTVLYKHTHKSYAWVSLSQK